jgi:hypothetical protein
MMSTLPETTTMSDVEMDKGEKDEVVAIRIGAYDIRSGRAGTLESALRVMKHMNMDIDLSYEAKLTDEWYTKQYVGYEVITMKVKSMFQGGVALI